MGNPSILRNSGAFNFSLSFSRKYFRRSSSLGKAHAETFHRTGRRWFRFQLRRSPIGVIPQLPPWTQPLFL